MGTGMCNNIVGDNDVLDGKDLSRAATIFRSITGSGYRDIFLILSISLAFIALMLVSLSSASSAVAGGPGSVLSQENAQIVPGMANPVPSIPGPGATPQPNPGPAGSNQPPAVISFTPDKPSPQQYGTAVTWTAQASDPEGDQVFYEFWQSGPSTGGTWIVKKGWSNSNVYYWHPAPTDAGLNHFRVWARDGYHAGPDSYDSTQSADFTIGSTPITPNQPPVLSSLNPDRPSPQQAGAAVTWTAQASDPDGDQVLYKFWLSGPSTGGSWAEKTGWTASGTWTWSTTPADAGQSQVSVWVRDGRHAGPESYDDNRVSGFSINAVPVNQPPVVNALNSNVPSPQQAGAAVTWIAQASDPDGDQILYQFWLNGPRTGGAWVSQRGWSASNSWTWTTSASDLGKSQVSVWVRDGKHAGPDSYDSNRDSSFTIIRVNQPPVINSFAPDRPSPQLAGTWVKWVASASDPDGDQILYRFLLRGPSTGGAWADQSGGWTRSNSWIWRTSPQDVGQSQIGAWIRDGKHAPASGYDDNAVGNFVIVTPSPPPNEPPVLTGLGANLPSPQQAGTLVRWVASATDPDGDQVLYRYWLKGPATGSSWQMVRDWSADSTWNWATTSADAGQSQVQVSVRDNRHAGPNGWDDQADAYFTVLPVNRPPQVTALNPSLPSPQPAGTPVIWTALASDPDGDPILYKFMLRGPSTGSAWTTVREWSNSNTWTWANNPGDAGDYSVTVYVRDGKHAGPEGYDTSKSAFFSLVPLAARKITTGGAFKDRPSLAFTIDGYLLAYQSWENGQGNLGDIRLQKFGPSWTAIKSIWAANNNAYQDSPSVLFAGGSYYLAYMSEEKGNMDIFVSKYDPDLNLVEAHQLTTDLTDQESPSLISVGNQFFLAYQSRDSGQSGNIYVTQFDQSWTPIRTVQVTNVNADLERPSIVFARGSFYVAYASGQGGNMDVYVRSLDANLSPGETKKMTTGPADHDYPSLNWVNGQFILLYSTLNNGGYDLYMDRFYRDWTPIESTAVVTDLSDQTWATLMYSPPDRTYWLGYTASDQEGQNIFVMPLQPTTTLKDCDIVVTFSATRAGAPYVLTARFYNNYGELTDPADLGISWNPQDAAALTPGSGMKRVSLGTYQFSSTFGSAGDKSFRIVASIDGCLALKTATAKVS